jgi:uracil-DNA glycosylase family 4
MDPLLRKRHCLQAMGITVWLDRRTPARADVVIAVEAVPAAATRSRGNARLEIAEDLKPSTSGRAADCGALDDLRARVAACTRCVLHQGRTQTVFGVGNPQAEWLLIGEAPGAEEDRRGEPFVGRAGQLLNAMLDAMGLRREQVYIANIVKCRPPDNRDPRPEEAAACEDYLKQQIALIRPRIILALGRIAAQNLLKVDTPLGRLRGRCFEYSELNVPLVVTYHPAYLLRSPREKRKTWDDLRFAMRIHRERQ